METCWGLSSRNGMKVKLPAKEMLATKESALMYAERLVELATSLGFDGWLMSFINIENEIDEEQIPNLKEFVSHLTKVLHSSTLGALVIWYDSVTVSGDLKWQDHLNEKNKPFFDLCDGIFMNYTWKVPFWFSESYPNLSAEVAGDRKYDVYMGIDVFGRGSFGGGQWTVDTSLDLLKRNNVSAAIFAPGWVYETAQPPNFHTAQNKYYSSFACLWWSLVEKSWGIVQTYPQILPFYSDFNQLSDAPWYNISCQSLQSSRKTSSKLGLLLRFSSPSHETKSILVAPQEPIPILVDHMFLKCLNSTKTSEYVALLGHISIKDHVQLLQQNFVSLHHGSSRLITYSLYRVIPILRVKLEWRQKQREDSVLPVYNVYAESVKSTDVLRSRKVLEKPRSERVFLGISHVPAYYVSELVLDSDVKGVSFVVQSCGEDGSWMKVDDSPNLLVDLEGLS
ncbi:LOW QUALITY PROTEIN: hypothetical protein HID58_044417 [Brassica napus]|uniref:mannosyl-glycoprotein endo-beta-N-acetylglucosaminidase n=1 Tax=Brassica napus TaxID=3708 RepID=A0ABQ8BJA8_BRANA|nr:LOW QUALITY PROTEIN: hypothetical protein HID58_044417 [Brassica napus]